MNVPLFDTPVLTSTLQGNWLLDQHSLIAPFTELKARFVNNCVTLPKVEVWCLRHPGPSTSTSQLLDGDCSHGWQIPATQPPAPMQHRGQAPVTLINSGKWWGWEGKKCLMLQKKPLLPLQHNKSTFKTMSTRGCDAWTNATNLLNILDHWQVLVVYYVKLHLK